MSPSLFRSVAFLFGLVGPRAVEVVAPHHAPTVALRQRWIANLSLGLVNGVIVSFLCFSCFALTAIGVLPAKFALLRALPLGPLVRIPLEILLLDLFTYFLHRAYHKAPLLWRFHQVHHSDLDLDVSSASRFHAGEVVISSILKLGFVIFVGISPQGLVAFEMVMLACAQLQHSNVRVPAGLERVLWWTLVPPAMHRIHHWPDRKDTDSNFGTFLTSWDLAFGTFNRKPELEAPVFGLPELREPSRLGLGPLAALPFRRRRVA